MSSESWRSHTNEGFLDTGLIDCDEGEVRERRRRTACPVGTSRPGPARDSPASQVSPVEEGSARQEWSKSLEGPLGGKERGALKFWDSSAVAPLLIEEAATSSLPVLHGRDP